MLDKIEKSIILISGGMDSAVCAGLAALKTNQLYGLHINYGQKTQEKELQSFNLICEHYNFTDKLIVDIEYLTKIGGSSLTDSSIEISKGNINSEEIPSSYVPFRNANILAIAVSWAEVIKANKIYIGAMEEDSSGYPDCREDFFKSFQQTLSLGTKPNTEIRIETPIIHNTKKDIIGIGLKIGVPFEKTWSCYKSNLAACGECDSCLIRLRGWEESGNIDPIKYENN
ncbi:7-cyano-7-deazaguanine synthase QueC [Candidatus Kapabacteria bacterium]|nr:7-cyano-7-deazaguanine synthase QueC [Candidatus Kapabacteria bacterium]